MGGTGAEDEKTQAVARELLNQHEAGLPYRTLTGELAPADLEEAYRVQQAFVAHLLDLRGVGITGYKIALTSQAMQEFCGVDHPLFGALLDDRVIQSPAEISRAAFQRLGVEFELALRLGRSVPPSETLYDATSIAPFVDAVIPAFELIDDRNAIYENFDALSLAADNAWGAAVVLGEPVTDWQGLNLEATPTVLETDGEIEHAMTGAALGNPLNALAWAANTLGQHFRPLSAGMIVMTGSTMKTRFPEAGSSFRYEIDGVGAVAMTIVP